MAAGDGSGDGAWLTGVSGAGCTLVTDVGIALEKRGFGGVAADATDAGSLACTAPAGSQARPATRAELSAPQRRTAPKGVRTLMQ